MCTLVLVRIATHQPLMKHTPHRPGACVVTNRTNFELKVNPKEWIHNMYNAVTQAFMSLSFTRALFTIDVGRCVHAVVYVCQVHACPIRHGRWSAWSRGPVVRVRK